MKKYLVIADTYEGGYGVEYHLFAICNTEKEAIQWIFDHPIIHFTRESWDGNREYNFSFLEGYNGKLTKEEFVKKVYIHEFTKDTSMFIGDYIE